MRGKGFGDDAEIAGIGITPAYAGKSLFTPFAKSWCKDHPRLCGEKLSGKMPLSSTTRITPAYAGKSLSSVFC